MKGSEIWIGLLGKALGIKGAQVKRDAFLRQALQGYCTKDGIERAIETTPGEVLTAGQTDAIADAVIVHHRKLAASSSFVAGLPGGYALLATIPADTAQYLLQCIVLSQKLAYIYGLRSLTDESGDRDRLIGAMTIFVGVMFGVSRANEAINTLARVLADKAARELVAGTAANAAMRPLVKRIAEALGLELNKKTLGKMLQKLLPLAGGVLSGGLTWVAFGKGAQKLQHALKAAEIGKIAATAPQPPEFHGCDSQ